MKILKAVLHWLDENIENSLMFVTYAACAIIIFEEVIRRFALRQQAPWSTTIPIYLFLWFSWLGASYNTKRRSHLCFTEIRTRLSYNWQFVCLMLDAALWIFLAAIVIRYAWDQVALQYNIGAIVAGTDDVPLWPAYFAIPAAWGLLVFRVIQNVITDIRKFIRKEKFVLFGTMEAE